ncbi:MAG TPA: type II/IV secretion system protein [Candidatus Paceibacterota bacterium]|nr:type II/IV secretion system protein [Candidatus Paceibacterota bacterium]
MSFLEELVQRGVLNREEVPIVLKLAHDTGTDIDSALLSRGVDERTLMRIKGEYLRMPVRVLGGNPVPYRVLQYIPENSARHYHFVPIGIKDSVLEIGITDPNNIEAMDALQFISTKIKMPFRVFLISEKDFAAVLAGYQGLPGEMSTALAQLAGEFQPLQDSTVEDIPGENKEKVDGASVSHENNNPNDDDDGVETEEDDGSGTSAHAEGVKKDLQKTLADAAKPEAAQKDKDGKSHIVEDAPVSKMVAVILRHATEGNASDIHIEHTGDKIRVRFRIDGELHTSILLPTNVHAAMVSRIKILSNLKLDEKRKPQDGRFSAKIDGRRIDFRVSTYPAYYGEKVVMRILDSEKGIKSIDQLDFQKGQLEKIKAAIKRPYGMILITGPTGSGKSTTLYSMLNELDRQKDNVVSLEDPVEYTIEGVNQSNVRPEIGYTFATGLRSILRQDPDVIMVGEIRDKETAQLAIQAALTGHLVFSTLHTNTAAGAIPRLIDMGVDPYLIAPTLILAIGQRLTRALCEGGGKPIPVDEAMQVMFDKQFEDLPKKFRDEIKIPDHVYEAVPTAECPGGTRGRMAVFEILDVNADVRHAILNKPVESEVFQVARNNGMLTMKEDALLKAFDGKIPYIEVNKL